jgi:high-affinity iron transporter
VIPTFVIFLREGIEASMIVAILLSYLAQSGHRRHFRDVFAGVVAAFGLIFAGGVAAYLLISHYDGSRVQTYFETATYLVAAAALTYMTFWMQSHAATIAGDLRERSEAALTGGARFGLGVIAFQAVGREGLETMVFTLAIVFASTTQAATPVHGQWLWLGAVAGLSVALAIAFAVYRLGARINFRRFFRVIGVVLMVFAAGLLADAVENAQALGWIKVGSGVLWSTRSWVTESSSMGDVMHSLLGYADRPTVAQAVVWVLYVALSVGAFVVLSRRRPARATPA